MELEAADVVDDRHWLWRLSSSQGGLLANHQVALDATAADYEGFVDLHAHLRWQADAANRLRSEAALVERVGRYIGCEVLGAVGSAMVATPRPRCGSACLRRPRLWPIGPWSWPTWASGPSPSKT